MCFCFIINVCVLRLLIENTLESCVHVCVHVCDHVSVSFSPFLSVREQVSDHVSLWALTCDKQLARTNNHFPLSEVHFLNHLYGTGKWEGKKIKYDGVSSSSSSYSRILHPHTHVVFTFSNSNPRVSGKDWNGTEWRWMLPSLNW